MPERKGEALADLDRFADDFGATGAHKSEHLRYVPINGAWSTGRPCPVCRAETGQPCIDRHVHAGREVTSAHTDPHGEIAFIEETISKLREMSNAIHPQGLECVLIPKEFALQICKLCGTAATLLDDLSRETAQ